MESAESYITEALRQVAFKTVSFVNVIFFHEEDTDEYTGSILPFQTTGMVGVETAFRFQHTIQQVVNLQSARGINFTNRRIGIIVADTVLVNAELIADAVTGVFNATDASVQFAIATDRHSWVDDVNQHTGLLQNFGGKA